MHSDPHGKKLSKKSDFVWKYIMGLETWASIYPSQVIEIHFFVKNSFFFFHQISKFWAVVLAFSDQILPAQNHGFAYKEDPSQ